MSPNHRLKLFINAKYTRVKDFAEDLGIYPGDVSKYTNEGGSQLLLEDFSPKMPNMKIITNELETNYILIYEGKMRVFKSEHSIKKYLSQLGFTEADFRTGYINIAKKSPQVGLN